MPKRAKDVAKRHAQEAILRLESAAYHVAYLHEVFKEHHPDDAEVLAIIGQQILLIEGELRDLWSAWWGGTAPE